MKEQFLNNVEELEAMQEEVKMVLKTRNKMTIVNTKNMERKQGTEIAMRDPEITDKGQCVMPSNLQRLIQYILIVRVVNMRLEYIYSLHIILPFAFLY